MEFYKIATPREAEDLIRILPEVIAVDTEYVKGDPRFTKLLSVILADSDRAWVVDPSLLPMLAPTIQSRRMIFLQDYNHCDTIILYKNGCDIRDCNVHNLIDMHHLLDENAPHDLASRITAEFNDDYKHRFWDIHESFEDASPDEQLEYASKDGIYTYRLGAEDITNIDSKRELWYLYDNVRKLSRALLDTELEGLCVNRELMQQTKDTMQEQINGCLPKLREVFNDYCEIWELQTWTEKLSKLKSDRGRVHAKRPTFSFTSDKQIAWLVYEALKLPVVTKTKKGNPATDIETLQALAVDYPALQPVVEYKELKSVYSTFVEGMLERVQDGKIYPNFNVSGTTTGRISHSNPNMGNLPKEGSIRNFFIPSPGFSIIGADYSQLEVVVELNLTEDPGLKEIVLGGASKHDLFKADLDKAGFKIPRSQVKNINFALQYGAGANKIAKMVGCSMEEAEHIIATFYLRFSGVKNLKDQTASLLKREGQVTNLAGRTRHFPKPRNKYEQFRQERQAYNFLIQGVAAEACNRAFYRFHDWCKKERVGRGLFSCHDEIIAETSSPAITIPKLVHLMGETSKDFNFKYVLKSVPYGPLAFWSKT